MIGSNVKWKLHKPVVSKPLDWIEVCSICGARRYARPVYNKWYRWKIDSQPRPYCIGRNVENINA